MENTFPIEISIVIVSYNTCELLRKCLLSAQKESEGIKTEIIVIDNGSKDQSAEMVQQEFPRVKLVAEKTNLGFAAANNIGFRMAQGRFTVMLNSDAFLQPGTLRKAVLKMNFNPKVGLAGGKLIGEDGAWQPSARQFPSILNDFLHLSGLASKYPSSTFFGKADRTWCDPSEPCDADWVPGAFAIARSDVLKQVDYFDERFFLYYEEVDLCKKIKAAGYRVCYWPELVIVHLGGESSKTVRHLNLSSSGTQLTLWRMRSALLYYRKHHGYLKALASKELETLWNRLRILKNSLSNNSEAQTKIQESSTLISLMKQAWQETSGGSYSPPKPW